MKNVAETPKIFDVSTLFRTQS